MQKRPRKPKSAPAIKMVDQTSGKSQPTPPGTKIIAFANFKGGVGKTSCAINVAGCLADQYTKKVLLVDLDVQSSLGQWLMGAEWWHNWSKHQAKTSYQIFLDVMVGSHAWSVANSTFQHESCPRLHVCPATFEMLDLDNRLNHELTKPIHPRPFQCLDIIIKPICSQFDYVILDCPPNMYWTTRNALFCADHIIIPTVPDFLSTAGLWRLVGHLKELREQFRLYDPQPARISGVVFNMFGMRKVLMSDTVENIEDDLQHRRLTDPVFSKNAFSAKTRYLNAIAEAQQAHMPVTVFKPTCEASKDIIQLTHKIVEGV